MRHFSLRHFSFSDGGAAAAAAPSPNVGPYIASAQPVGRGGVHGPVRLVIAVGVLLVAAVAFGTATLIASSRERALADEKRELNNTAYILAEQSERIFQSVELVQRSLVEHIQSLDIATSDDLSRLMSGPETYLALQGRIAGLPQISALTLLNASGKMINSSRGFPIPDFNFSNRDYFKALVSAAGPNSYLSEPVLDRVTGYWTIYFARKLTGRNGEFIGLVLAAMEMHHFEEIFGSILLGSEAAIALFRSDGMLLARDPHVDSATGRIGGKNGLFQDLWLGSSDADQLVALHGLTHYAVVVSVATTRSGALAQWRQEANVIIGAGVIAALTVGIVIFFIAREMILGIRRSSHRLQHQKMQLDTALNNMLQGLLMSDATGRVVLCNQRYREIYGVPDEMLTRGCTRVDLVRHHFTSGLMSGDPEKQIALWAKLATQGESYTRSAETSDGRMISVVNRAIGGGYRVSTHEDITDRRRLEQERDRSRDFLDQVIENVPVTIVVKDARTLQYILINRAGEKLWGMPREQFIGKTPHEIFDKQTADFIEENDRKLLETGSNFYVPDHAINTPRGPCLVTSNRLTIRDRNGDVQYLLGVIEDVTERKGVEDQLRQAQKMEAVGNLTGGMAHDFNNLLTVIMGNLDLLQEDVAGNYLAEEKIDIILQATERGADLTRHMLAFSRRQPLQAKPVDVNALIANTMRLLSRTLGENITVDVRTTPDLALALVDEAQLETALLNIAINARDAMPGGGSLTISTRVSELDEDYTALHPGVAPGAYVAIEIADSGTGIPPDVLERIFEPFFTTKPAGLGTGLGLSMVYGFIKQSGGHINAYSEVGRGTVFRLFLPLADPLANLKPMPGSSEQLVAKPAGNEVILAVEDNPEIRMTVVVQLRDLGYQVREADCADAALRILDAPERIDLLFTDMIMPGGLNGKELATKARAKRADLKVLFTSGFPGTSNEHGVQLDDDDVLLSKPYRKHDLAKAVERLLHS